MPEGKGQKQGDTFFRVVTFVSIFFVTVQALGIKPQTIKLQNSHELKGDGTANARGVKMRGNVLPLTIKLNFLAAWLESLTVQALGVKT